MIPSLLLNLMSLELTCTTLAVNVPMVAVLEKINQKLAHLPVVLVGGREGDTQSAFKPDVLGAW